VAEPTTGEPAGHHGRGEPGNGEGHHGRVQQPILTWAVESGYID
jgi:hypothetical protein